MEPCGCCRKDSKHSRHGKKQYATGQGTNRPSSPSHHPRQRPRNSYSSPERDSNGFVTEVGHTSNYQNNSRVQTLQQHQQLPIGLINLDETCYINSVVQVLFNIPEFRAVMCSFPHNYEALDIFTEGCCDVANRFVQTLKAMERGIEKGTKHLFPESLSGHLCARARLNEVFGGPGQQDAHEFWNFVQRELQELFEICANHDRLTVDVTSMEESLLNCGKPEDRMILRGEDTTHFNPVLDFLNNLYLVGRSHVKSEDCDPCTGRHQGTCDILSTLRMSTWSPFLGSFIDNMFHGRSETMIQCLHCETPSFSYEKWNDLAAPLDLGEGVDASQYSLLDLLQLQFDEEILKGDNMYECEVCQRKTEAYRKVSIETLPTVLTIRMVRFGMDANGTLEKIDTNCDIPTIVDLSTCISPWAEVRSTQYELVGIVCHIGNSIERGHYISTVRSPRDGKWDLCDDHNIATPPTDVILDLVTGCPEGYVNPYLMFYRQI